MVIITSAMIEFWLNNKVEMIFIGAIAYAIVGIIMRLADNYLGIWFGKRGGLFLWLVVALALSAVYHSFL